MADDASQLPQEKDPDLVRWARELGVTYAELVSTLNDAGPTFKEASWSSSRRGHRYHRGTQRLRAFSMLAILQTRFLLA